VLFNGGTNMGSASYLCPILIFATFGLVWFMNMQFKKSLIILVSAMIISDLSLGYITGLLNPIISFIPYLNPSWEGPWTNEQLIILSFGSVIAFFLAKIFRFTVPIYLAIQSHDTGYEVIDILRPEILVNRTGTTTTRGYKVIDSSYDETKTAVFKKIV
jgi:hypothetical protein